ncbi:hypothetical protein IU450_04425 [Nocardia abscessus]|nr:hypothetical protein [Nocardia abscessus]
MSNRCPFAMGGALLGQAVGALLGQAVGALLGLAVGAPQAPARPVPSRALVGPAPALR